MSLLLVIYNFFFYLSLGTVASMAILKQAAIGRQFFLYHGIGSAIVMLANYLLVGRLCLTSDTAYWLAASWILLLVFVATVCEKKQIALVSYFTSLIAGLGALIMQVTAAHPYPLHVSLIVNGALSALLLGFSMNAMLLGHWYLVQPKLSIDELRRISLALILLIGLRFLWGTYGLIDLLQGKNEAQIYKYLFSATPGIFIIMRWCWGLLGPLCLTYPIWGTVKIRSTQSATGILYVVVLFVITGEILSLYLAAFHGISM